MHSRIRKREALSTPEHDVFPVAWPCVAAAMDLFFILSRRSRRRHTYRFILGPEYFGGAGFLSRLSPGESAELRGGFYLDILANRTPLGCNLSYFGDSRMDNLVRAMDAHGLYERPTTGFCEPFGNDELLYNGPGLRIPTIGFCSSPYPQYHTAADDMTLFDPAQYARALRMLEDMVDALESDVVPRRLYKGPLYMSRYNLPMESPAERIAYKTLTAVQHHMEGELSCLDIAGRLGADYFLVRDFCRQMVDLGLVEELPAPPPRVSSLPA